MTTLSSPGKVSWLLVAGCWCDLRGSGGETVELCNSGADRGEDTAPTTQEPEPGSGVGDIYYLYYTIYTEETNDGSSICSQ